MSGDTFNKTSEWRYAILESIVSEEKNNSPTRNPNLDETANLPVEDEDSPKRNSTRVYSRPKFEAFPTGSQSGFASNKDHPILKLNNEVINKESFSNQEQRENIRARPEKKRVIIVRNKLKLIRDYYTDSIPEELKSEESKITELSSLKSNGWRAIKFKNGLKLFEKERNGQVSEIFNRINLTSKGLFHDFKIQIELKWGLSAAISLLLIILRFSLAFKIAIVGLLICAFYFFKLGNYNRYNHSEIMVLFSFSNI